MRSVILMPLLVLAMMANGVSWASVLEGKGGVRTLLGAADPARDSALSPPAEAEPRTAPSSSRPAHVPLPVKTITIRAFEDIDDIDEELESARRQTPEDS